MFKNIFKKERNHRLRKDKYKENTSNGVELENTDTEKQETTETNEEVIGNLTKTMMTNDVVENESFPYLYITDANDENSKHNISIQTIANGKGASNKTYKNCLFGNTRFYKTKLTNIVFEECDFTNFTFLNVELENIVFKKCVFKRTTTTQYIYGFNLVTCKNVCFDECKLICMGINCMNAVMGTTIDMSTSKFGYVNLVNSDIHAYILPETENLRYGKVLDKPITGYKECNPLTDEIHLKYIKGECSLSDCSCDRLGTKCLVKLEIPKGSVVYTTDSQRYRTNKVIVESIFFENGKNINFAFSEYDNKTLYEKGCVTEVDNFDTCPTKEYANGIYFTIPNKE